MHYVIHFVIKHCSVTCEKDVGMGLCTFNFVLRLSYTEFVCLLFGTSSLHLLKKKIIDLFV